MADETVFRFVLEDDGKSPESIARAETNRSLENTRSGDEDTVPIPRLQKSGREAAGQAEAATPHPSSGASPPELPKVGKLPKSGAAAAGEAEAATPHPSSGASPPELPKVGKLPKSGAAAAGEAEAAAGLSVVGALGVAAAAITLKEAFGLLKAGVTSLNENIRETIERLKNLSPELAAAQGNAEVMRVLADLESASRNGQALAGMLQSTTKLETELGKIKNDVLGVFAEKLTPIVELMANLADVAEDNKEGIKTLLNAILLPLTALSKVAEALNRNFEKKEDQIPTREIFGMFVNAPNLQVGPAVGLPPVVPGQPQPGLNLP